MVYGIFASSSMIPNQLSQQFITTIHRVTGPLHSHCRECFNFVGLHDIYVSVLQKKYIISNWESKFIMSLLESSLINCFAIHPHFCKTDFGSYCKSSLTLCAIAIYLLLLNKSIYCITEFLSI